MHLQPVKTIDRYPPMPPFKTRIINAIREVPAIALSLFEMQPEEVRAAVVATCRNCPGGFYNPTAYLGLGGCAHPSCGCITKLKTRFKQVKCPENYWKIKL